MTKPVKSSAVDWTKHVAEAENSGVSLAEYARRHGLRPKALYSARLYRRQGVHKVSSPFAKVVEVNRVISGAAQEARSTLQVEVRFPNGITLSLSGGEIELEALIDRLSR